MHPSGGQIQWRAAGAVLRVRFAPKAGADPARVRSAPGPDITEHSVI